MSDETDDKKHRRNEDKFFSDDFKSKMRVTTQQAMLMGVAVAVFFTPIMLIGAITTRIGKGGQS